MRAPFSENLCLPNGEKEEEEDDEEEEAEEEEEDCGHDRENPIRSQQQTNDSFPRRGK